MLDRLLTLTPQRVRHSIRYRLIDVVDIASLTPCMPRIVFGGAALEGFYSPGFDDHVKLVLPAPGQPQPADPSVSSEGLRWVESANKPVVRDYTPRFFDPKVQQLTIDFALHKAGPATRWAFAARPGDKLGIAGPRQSLLVPVGYDWHLLAGDDTALPDVARRLAELPIEAQALALIEVDNAADVQSLTHRCTADIQWIFRHGVPGGESHALIDRVRELVLPQGSYYAWVAAEIHVAQVLRRLLLDCKGANPKALKAAGYWRIGRSGAHEVLSD